VPDGLNWIEVCDTGLILRVDRAVYTDDAIFRACYSFTDRCYLFLERHGSDQLTIRFGARHRGSDLRAIAGEFGNELLNQRLRQDLAKQTYELRHLIVARAFADATFEP
jgi:His-Xaa-Ser system protein HxsD